MSTPLVVGLRSINYLYRAVDIHSGALSFRCKQEVNANTNSFSKKGLQDPADSDDNNQIVQMHMMNKQIVIF